MKNFLAILPALPLVTLSAIYLTGFPAQAIPASQGKCADTAISTTTANGAQAIPGMNVSVNNATGSTVRYVVNISADAGIDPNAELRVSYSINGSPPQENVFGPANFINNAQFTKLDILWLLSLLAQVRILFNLTGA